MPKFTHDPAKINNAILLLSDLPFGSPGGATAEEAARKPGNAVKSIERTESGGPKHFGKLVSYGHTCVVLDPPGRTPGREPFVWTGTQSEYHDTWVVD